MQPPHLRRVAMAARREAVGDLRETVELVAAINY